MINRRTRSRFQPDDPSSVRARFARVVARSVEKGDAEMRDIKPVPPSTRAPRGGKSRKKLA